MTGKTTPNKTTLRKTTVRKTTVGDASLSKPNEKDSYEVAQSDLPVHCPMPGSRLWDSHPQVFIAFDANGHGKCPYCGADYHLSA